MGIDASDTRTPAATAAGAAPAPTYRNRSGDATRERASVLAVWRGNLGQDAHMAVKYDWFYAHAPAGAPLLQVLEHRDAQAPVGVCAAGRRRMVYSGRSVQAGVLVDLAVLPEHRSLGPALMLQQGLFAAGRAQLDLLYGFPNPKAAPVFKRIGYVPLAQMIRYVRVLRHGPYLRRRMLAPLAAALGPVVDAGTRLHRVRKHPRARGYRAQWHVRVPDVQALWLQSEKPAALTALRDQAYLRWRFDDAPDSDFRHLLLRDAAAEDDAVPAAWFATRGEGHTLHIHDFWCRDSGAAAREEIIAALLEAAYAAGHGAVSIELATDAQRLQGWLALGFEARSQRPLFGYWNRTLHDADSVPPLHIVSADEDE
jgi:hypothetical protein